MEARSGVGSKGVESQKAPESNQRQQWGRRRAAGRTWLGGELPGYECVCRKGVGDLESREQTAVRFFVCFSKHGDPGHSECDEGNPRNRRRPRFPRDP